MPFVDAPNQLGELPLHPRAQIGEHLGARTAELRRGMDDLHALLEERATSAKRADLAIEHSPSILERGADGTCSERQRVECGGPWRRRECLDGQGRCLTRVDGQSHRRARRVRRAQ